MVFTGEHESKKKELRRIEIRRKRSLTASRLGAKRPLSYLLKALCEKGIARSALVYTSRAAFKIFLSQPRPLFESLVQGVKTFELLAKMKGSVLNPRITATSKAQSEIEQRIS